MFRVSTRPIIRITQNCNYSFRYCAATSLQRGQAWPRWREVAVPKIWPVPEAVVTGLCTPDDGYGWHPKHVEWTCRIINRLLCVASRWTIISIYKKLLLRNSLPSFSFLHFTSNPSPHFSALGHTQPMIFLQCVGTSDKNTPKKKIQNYGFINISLLF